MNRRDLFAAGTLPEYELYRPCEPKGTLGAQELSSVRPGAVQDPGVDADSQDKEDGKRAKRERTFLWLFLAAVFVISSLTTWLLLAKIRSP